MRLVCCLAAFSIVVAATVACGGGGSIAPTPTSALPTSTAVLATATEKSTAGATPTIAATAELAPADSPFPAAGSCAGPPSGNVVTWTVNPDIASPRCNQIAPDQHVSFVNATGAAIQVQLGSYNLTIAAGETKSIETPVGTYLAPGVHVAHASVYGGGSGPEVWVIVPGVTPAP